MLALDTFDLSIWQDRYLWVHFHPFMSVHLGTFAPYFVVYLVPFDTLRQSSSVPLIHLIYASGEAGAFRSILAHLTVHFWYICSVPCTLMPLIHLICVSGRIDTFGSLSTLLCQYILAHLICTLWYIWCLWYTVSIPFDSLNTFDPCIWRSWCL